MELVYSKTKTTDFNLQSSKNSHLSKPLAIYILLSSYSCQHNNGYVFVNSSSTENPHNG